MRKRTLISSIKPTGMMLCGLDQRRLDAIEDYTDESAQHINRSRRRQPANVGDLHLEKFFGITSKLVTHKEVPMTPKRAAR
jgi:hypothetical protein